MILFGIYPQSIAATAKVILISLPKVLQENEKPN
ncbi:hypothetical protein FOCG_18425 [Fusarium oxysporum f. sp. radicis-lycopersici 26381]|nr:hypothetical protein FOCG_18425 [Fusarium oxysporum f. sp. radicis-lycopersici 26381]